MHMNLLMLFRVACTRLSHEGGKRYEISACQSHDNSPTYSGRTHLISLVPFRTRLQRYRAGLSARGSNGAGVASFQTRNLSARQHSNVQLTGRPELNHGFPLEIFQSSRGQRS